MQKQILFVLTLSSTFSYGMEKKAILHTTTPLNEYIFSQYYPAQKLEIPELANGSETITAIKTAIALKNCPQSRPICMFSSEQKNPISIATTYALNNETIKRILIIDEDSTAKTITTLSSDKKIFHGQLTNTLWNFLYHPDSNPKLNIDRKNTNIDLALYNINVERDTSTSAEERNTNIIALLHHLIPTIFIFSGNTDTYKNETKSLTIDITNMEQKYRNILNAPEPRQALQLLTKSFESNLSSSSSQIANPELTSSIISMKLKVERRYLKQKLNLQNSVCLDDEASSSHNDDDVSELESLSDTDDL